MSGPVLSFRPLCIALLIALADAIVACAQVEAQGTFGDDSTFLRLLDAPAAILERDAFGRITSIESIDRDAVVEAVAGLRRLVSAGEALPEAIFGEWKERFGQEIIDGLGSTEALHVFLSNRPGDCVPGTPGRPVPVVRRPLEQVARALNSGETQP